MSKALLLEDDHERGKYIRGLLQQHGYKVIWARSLSEAKIAWRRNTFALAALDHDLGLTDKFGNGCMFTCWVVRQPDVCSTQFIVHSTNIIAAPKMVRDLGDAGCHVARVWPNSIGAYLQNVMVAPAPG